MFYVGFDITSFAYRVMPPRRNPKRARMADQYSVEASHSLHDERDRDAPVPSPIRQQNDHNPPPITKQRRYKN